MSLMIRQEERGKALTAEEGSGLELVLSLSNFYGLKMAMVIEPVLKLP